MPVLLIRLDLDLDAVVSAILTGMCMECRCIGLGAAHSRWSAHERWVDSLEHIVMESFAGRDHGGSFFIAQVVGGL